MPGPVGTRLDGSLPRDEPNSAPWLIAFAILLVSAAVAPLGPWLVDMDPYHAVLAVTHASVCAVGAAVAVHQRFRPVLLVASVFPYCWLVVPSVYQISHGLAAWGDPGVTLDFSATLRAQLVLGLGQAFLLVGYLTVVRPRRESEAREWSVAADSRRRILVIASLMTAATLVLIPFVVAQVGGVSALFTSRAELNQSLAASGVQQGDQATRALIKTVPAALATSSLVLLVWLVRSSERGDPLRLRAGAVAGVTFLALLVVANPFAYSRFQVLAAFGPVALAVLRPRTRGTALTWLVGLCTAFLLAYPAASYFRLGTDTGASGPLLASKDYDGFQQAINTVTFVDQEGISYLMHLVSGLLFFIPRAIWTAKARPSAFEVAAERGYTFQNLSMPFPSEAYLDGGWIAVVLVMALLGLLFGLLDRAWVEQSRFAVVATYLALAQVGLWRGPFGSLAPVFGFALGLLVFTVLTTGRSSGGDLSQGERQVAEVA